MPRCRALAYTNKPDQLVVQCRLEDGHRGSHIEHQATPNQEEIAMQEAATSSRALGHRDLEHYAKAAPEAQATIDAVIAAVARMTSPLYELEVPGPGTIAIFLEWHDGAQYRVSLTDGGELLRLFRLQYSGFWEWDEVEQRDVPGEEWRTVRAFAKDRAGRVLGPALAGRAAAKSWTEAAAR